MSASAAAAAGGDAAAAADRGDAWNHFMLFEGVTIQACVGYIMIHGRNVHITKTKYDIHPKELSFQSLALFS